MTTTAEAINFGDVAVFAIPSGAARDVVETLISDISLRPVYIGGVDQATVVDNLTRLWFHWL